MEIKDRGLKLTVDYDTNPINPRDFDNLGKMVCFHPSYFLGDKHEFKDYGDFFNSKDFKNFFALRPIFLYDHSGLAVSTNTFNGRVPNAEWDSMQVGYIYITKDEVKKKLGIEPINSNRDYVCSLLDNEVEIYNNYLQGNTFMYQIEDKQNTVLDSCGGFLAGSLKEAIEEMKENAPIEHESLFSKLEKSLKQEAYM